MISVFNVGDATFSWNTTILLVVGAVPAAKAFETIVVLVVLAGLLIVNNPKLKLQTTESFFKQADERKAVVYNDTEDLRILSKLELSTSSLDYDYTIDLQNMRKYAYMNFKDFSKPGFKLRVPKTIETIRYTSISNKMFVLETRIGHDIIGILDGDETKPYIMNDYYETELNDYTRGRVYFPIRNLAVGLHTISFRAWDVYNNPITAEIQFVVVGDQSITLSHVLNYPNPFVSYTEFWFSHNRPFEPLEVQVQVMTITGKIVWTKNQTVFTDGFLSREITWDGKDDFGDRIGKGVYVYKLTVKSTLSNKKAEKIEKLVIL